MNKKQLRVCILVYFVCVLVGIMICIFRRDHYNFYSYFYRYYNDRKEVVEWVQNNMRRITADERPVSVKLPGKYAKLSVVNSEIWVIENSEESVIVEFWYQENGLNDDYYLIYDSTNSFAHVIEKVWDVCSLERVEENWFISLGY